jgi:hypothetical protein
LAAIKAFGAAMKDVEIKRETNASMERDKCWYRDWAVRRAGTPIGLGAEERMVDTKAVEVVVEEGDQLVWLSISSVSD